MTLDGARVTASICPYCGEPGADTSDHIPPKQLLPKPLPPHPEPIIVKAHRSCNEGFREDDEYFCSSILTEHSVAPKASDALARFVRGIRMKENRGLRALMRRSLVPTGLYGPDGEPLFWIRYDASRVERVLKRIVQGLSKYEFKIDFLDPQRISVVRKGTIDLSLFDPDKPLVGRIAYTGAFRFFSQFRDPPSNLEAIWLLMFYERIIYQLAVSRLSTERHSLLGISPKQQET